MNIMGIDLSINSPGIVMLNTESKINDIKLYLLGTNSINKYKRNKHYFLLQDNKNNKTISVLKRIISTRTIITQLINKYRVKYVGIENYSFSSSGRSVYQIGELHGIIKSKLYEMKIPFLPIEPSVIKIAGTGKGNSKKDIMIEKIKEKYNIKFEDLKKVDDLYDAYMIAAIIWTKLNFNKLDEDNIDKDMIRALTGKTPTRNSLIDINFINQ